MDATAVCNKHVTLIVGGQHFVTTVGTLTRDESPSYFSAICQHRFGDSLPEALAAEATESSASDGSAPPSRVAFTFFVDRDPTHFRCVLNHLRDGGDCVLPSSEHALRELSREARFYDLIDLQRRCDDAVIALTTVS